VVTPGPASTTPGSSGSPRLPLAEGAPPETIVSLAQERAIPVEYVSELDHAPTLTRLASLSRASAPVLAISPGRTTNRGHAAPDE
jgi:hypothetical protein